MTRPLSPTEKERRRRERETDRRLERLDRWGRRWLLPLYALYLACLGAWLLLRGVAPQLDGILFPVVYHGALPLGLGLAAYLVTWGRAGGRL